MRSFFYAYFHAGAAGYIGFIALGLSLTLLSLPPGPLPVLVLIADAPLLWILFHRDGTRWKRWTFLYGALHFGFCLRWLSEVHPVMLLTSAIVLAPVYLLLGLAIRRFVQHGAPFVLTVGICVVFEELLRTVWCGGMPWPARSLAFAGDAAAQGGTGMLVPAAALFGSYSFAFLAGMSSAVASRVPEWLVKRGTHEATSGWRLLRVAMIPFVFLTGLGVYAGLRRTDYAETGKTTTDEVLVIQADIPQTLKHSRKESSSNEIFNRHIDLSVEGLAPGPDGQGVFAVLWPETMLPWSFVGPDLAHRFPRDWENQVVVMRRIREDVPLGRDAAWLIGVIHQFRRGEERHPDLWAYGSFDSLFHFEPSRVPGPDDPVPVPEGANRDPNSGWRPPWEQGRHDKVHLVPGGEYTPGGDVFPPLRWFRNFVSVIPELDAGRRDQAPFALGPDAIKAGSVICYDLAFPATCRSWRRRGADVLLNPANYGWYGKTGFRDQIQAIARLRAAELSVPIVMAGNTGPTAFYDPLGASYGRFYYASGGEPVAAGRIDTTHSRGYARASLRLDPGAPTPYVRWGDLPWYAFALGLLTWTLLRSRMPRAASPDEGIG